MAAQIDEEILDNFRVSGDDFRDLDSIVRRHCDSVKYYIHRESAVGGYDTDEVEELLKERNGTGARITSVTVCATGSSALKFNIDFDDCVTVNGECDDRAHLVLLTTEAKAVIRDRMKGRTPRRNAILQAAAVFFFLLAYFGFQQYQNFYSTQYDARQAAQSEQAAAPYAQEVADYNSSTQELLNQATKALAQNDLNAEVGILLQVQISQWRQQIALNDVPSASYPPDPWWASSYWLVIAVALAAAAVAAGLGYTILPSNRSAFLIGDEKMKEIRDNKRRKYILGVGVTLAIGIASSLIANLA